MKKSSLQAMKSIEKNSVLVNELEKLSIKFHEPKSAFDEESMKVRRDIVKNYKKYLNKSTILKAKK